MSGTEVIVITSGKGGVGKTTTTCNLGICLAKLGKKVLILDTDIGLRNMDMILNAQNQIVYDIVDLINEKCGLWQALIQNKLYPKLFFLPAAQSVDKDAVNESQMIDLCKRLKPEFDYILIDCPAGIEQGFRNAVSGADKAIIVITPDRFSLRDADRIIGLLEDNKITDYSIIINRISVEMVHSGKMPNVDEVIESLNAKLLGIIPDDYRIIVALNDGESLLEDKKAKSGRCYMNIARRITGEHIKLEDLEKRNFLSKLFNR